MHLVRPCTLDDVSSIESLVRDNHAQISSLPRKRARLVERIEHSLRSFEDSSGLTGGQFFLFVLEDTQTGQILGCSGIAMNNESKRPFYNYRLGELIHASETFDIHTPVSVLHLTHELTGYNVLCSFAIKRELLGTTQFDLISRARFMFMRQFSDMFSENLVVELQGVCNEEGQSAFWDSWGRNFFNMDYASANYHVATKSRTFLAELMPPHPVYVKMLTPEAQAVIGRHDDRARDIHALLEREGFQRSPYVDIFDAGEVMIAKRDEVTTYKDASKKTLLHGSVSTGLPFLVCNDAYTDFRCGLVQLTDGRGDVLRVNTAEMEHLKLRSGSEYFFSPC
ncbi:hypothetical protein A3742_01825 [Oleiphilus sp. HI0071]|uniref:arginine N-succinyltransferase n=1 Tax=unclassified Oleiphilus TaxID=2631174 RepID=UPI0007C26850|nr:MULTISPECIES: arginine N-succinyltransferase [unclassified Oleiphilus]KZY63634.1 hypothetical protein A3737_18285 [Oleiphilus sp. HI0065]KZY80482.1 hypothetical protein A3742_01825 [Oleiphilus sp. HI0071]KZY99074.1 hypothetical protein A3744_30780 [Oleiphilus sp. HI0073]KZZ44914.1 hypothetical protein A3758_02940 [Oleiphilus sp. HI0118]KZZ49224.1 hypothetical protein A3760_03280 [Oleiphilus sp. HI0122]KZZ79472.1 hypothetical protein A3767_17025 [Oleiphilus sp. HI0133]